MGSLRRKKTRILVGAEFDQIAVGIDQENGHAQTTGKLAHQDQFELHLV